MESRTMRSDFVTPKERLSGFENRLLNKIKLKRLRAKVSKAPVELTDYQKALINAVNNYKPAEAN
jgi:hypothetical protein